MADGGAGTVLQDEGDAFGDELVVKFVIAEFAAGATIDVFKLVIIIKGIVVVGILAATSVNRNVYRTLIL